MTQHAHVCVFTQKNRNQDPGERFGTLRAGFHREKPHRSQGGSLTV